MDAHQFLIEKGILSVKESVPVMVVEKWLKEFSELEYKSKVRFRAEKYIQKLGLDEKTKKYLEEKEVFSFLKSIPLETLKKLVGFKVFDFRDKQLLEKAVKDRDLDELLCRLRSEDRIKLVCDMLLEK